MASAEDYANWIVKNADKKGTPEFETVAKAYKLARSQTAEAPATGGPSVTAPTAPSEGMPAPRKGDVIDRALGAGWSAITGGRNLQADLEMAREATAPPSISDIGRNWALEAQRASDVAQAGGQSAIENLKAGRPASALLGAGQQLLGGAGIALSPISGLARSYVYDPISRMFGADTAERANLVANMLATPGGAGAVAKPVTTTANILERAITPIENVVNPRLNALATAVGEKGPEIVNALRGSTSGVETTGQAAAPAGSVSFSQFTRELEKHAADTAADAARTQDALLAARSNMAEGRMAEGSRKLADAVAAPNKQKVGQDLINIADQEKRVARDTLINPKFENADTLSGGARTDINDFIAKAEDAAANVDQNTATALSRRLSKIQNGQATLSEIGDIRTAINRAAAKAKATGDAGGYSDLIGLHKELDKAVTTSASLPPEAVAAYKDALKTYATEYAPRFKTGLQFDLFKVRQGVNAIKPENVVDKFFNDAENTDQFIALFGGNRDAMLDAKVGIEGMFREKAIKDGVIDTKAANKFLDDYGAQIDKLDARGLGIRDKLTSLVDETARVTAPEARIAEVRGAIKGGELPKGPASAAAQQQASSLANAASAEDLTALRDAVEIARRRGAYEQLSKTPTKAETGVPIVPSEAPSFLNLPLRISTEVYRRVAGKLNEKMSRQLGELLSDPKRLNEAADMIEKALAMKAKQGRRSAVNVNVPIYAGAIPAGVNALAPPSQNSLANQTGR